MVKVCLDRNNRYNEIKIPEGITKITVKVSREKCNDILVEMVDAYNNATSKPLHKTLPDLKLRRSLAKLRFIMNDFSTKPIEIALDFK